MADWLSELRANIQADIDDATSGQGTFSREVEAAGRNWASGMLHTGAALTGSDGLRDAAREQSDIAALRLSRSALPQTWDDAEGASGVAGYVGHLAIQSLPYMAEFAGGAAGAGRALAGKAVSQGAARTGGGVAASYPSSAGQIYSAQDDQAGEYDSASALPLAGLHAGANAVFGPEAWIARGLPTSALKNRAGRAVVGATTTGAGEAVTETFQTGLEQVGRSAVDPEYDILSEEAGRERREAAIGGGLLGAVTGGVAGGVTSRRGNVPSTNGNPNQSVDLLALPEPGSGPTLYADELGNVSDRPDITRQTQQRSTQQGQGELFRPGEVESQAPTAPSAPIDATTQPEPAGMIDAAEGQGDLLDGTAAGVGAEVANEVQRERARLETDYSQTSLVRELRAANKYKADAFVTQLAADLSSTLRSGNTEGAVELLNDHAARPNSVKRNNILRRAAELVDTYDQRVADITSTETAGRQLANEQMYREDAAAARQRKPSPGADARLPETGTTTEQQIRERNRESALDEQLADTNRVAESSIRKTSADQRRAILKRILEDPETVNPTRRFIAELRKAGYRRGVTDTESRTIRRFEEVSEAFAEDPAELPSGENELTPDVTGIDQRSGDQQTASAERTTESRPPRSKYAPENFKLESPPSTEADFNALERAASRRARRRGEATSQEAQPPTRDPRQGELFTPTGKPTRAAQGLPPQSRRSGVQPAFSQPAREPVRAPDNAPDNAPDRAPEASDAALTLPQQDQAGADRWSKMVDAALDRERVDIEEAMRLYSLLDEGKVDEVKAALTKAARQQRSAGGQTTAAKVSATKDAPETTDEADTDSAEDTDTGGDTKRFSQSDADKAVPSPTTVESLSKLRDLFMSPARFNQLVTLHATQTDAIASGALSSQDVEGRGRVRGFTVDGKVHLIAENIETGTELAVFLHEIGGHLGLKNLIGVRNYLNLRKQIETWAARDDGSVEARVGKWAVSRAEGEKDPLAKNEEIVAYAIEGLVREGVDPSVMKGEAGTWFRRLWAAAKNALRKLGIKRLNELTGQNLVDLAMGAADLELRGTNHGTAAKFRTFSHKYMGTGEGNQAFGWGTYVAEHGAVADIYRKADSVKKFKRQDRGNVMRTATNIAENEILLWEATLRDQSELVRNTLLNMPELRDVLDSDWATGEIAYLSLSEELGSDKAASEALDRAGVKGHKFMDRVSRSRNTHRHTPTYNHVIYNDRNIIRVATQPGGDRTKVRFSEAPRNKTAFDRWFGDSKVVDAAGNPQVVYHGTNVDVTEFQPGTGGDGARADTSGAIFFASAPHGANFFARTRSRNYNKDGGNVLPVYLSVKNPAEISFDGDRKDSSVVQQAIADAKANGHDGLLIRDVVDGTAPAMDVWVAFEPTQAKSATGNSGDFDPSNPDIRFSTAGKPIERANHPASEVSTSLAATFDDLRKKGMYASAFGRDLRDMLEKVLPTHRDYFETMATKQATMGQLTSQVDSIMVDGFAVTGTDRDALNGFLMASTRAQKWGFKPSWKDAPEVEIDRDMARQFKALTPEAREIAKRIFEHGHTTLQTKNAVVRQAFDDALKEVDSENIGAQEKRRLKDRIKRQLNLYDDTFRGIKGPYAPLGRFGNHVTVAKSAEYTQAERAAELGDGEAKNRVEDLRQDADHYAVFFSETAGDAELKKQELDRLGKFEHTERFEKEAYYRGIQDAPWVALLRLKNMVAEEADTHKDKKGYTTHVNALLRDLYLDSLAEASARKHDLRRESVEGADPNMLRAFASKGKADAHFIAALQHNGRVIEDLSKMRAEAAADTAPGGVSKADRKRALNEVLARHAQGLEIDTSPLGGLQDKAMALTSFHMLATVPRYYVQNLLQAPMVSMPTMAGRYGMGKSWSEMRRAYKDMVAGFGTMRETMSGRYDLDALDVTPDERAMLERMRSTGLLDVGLQYDLGYWESTSERGPSAAVAKVNHLFRTIARQVEVVNRVSTALAAYRLERARSPGDIDPETGVDPAASRVADDIVSQTHGDYSYLNKSRLFRALPKIVTQFRTYQMIQLSLIARYTHQAFKGASKEDRALGRRTMAYILGQHAVVTGALGLPAVQGIAYAMSAVFGDDDEPANGERFLRQIIGDNDWANVILKGVPAGMGLDMSGYIGMGESTSLMPYTDINLTDRKGYAQTVVGLMGPFVSGVLPNVADGLGTAAKGDYYKGLEMMMPSGIRSGMRAMRIANEGVTNRRGDQLLTADEISTFDATMQALGFETTKFQELRRRRGDLFEYDQYFRNRSSALKHQYVKAAKSNDARTMSELRREWQRLQVARGRVGFKVQPISTLVKAPAQQRKRERATHAGVQYTPASRGFVEAD